MVARGSALASAAGRPVILWMHQSSLCQGHPPTTFMGRADWGHSPAGLAGQWAKAASLPASPAEFRQDLKVTSRETLGRENSRSKTSSSGKKGKRKTWEVQQEVSPAHSALRTAHGRDCGLFICKQWHCSAQTCNQPELGKLHVLLGNSMIENKALAHCPEYIAEVGWVRSREELEQKR